ncbi:MAG: gfo/Idh/MocA family oxidoreductase, partial [Phycisphaerae bacterium]
NKTQTPIDVYDSVVMSSIIPLSEKSIARGSAPVECPDFTRGKWKARPPTFALDVG